MASVKILGEMDETVVLLHGFAGTRHSWDPVVDRLDGERYRPLALDLRGHGRASAERPITFEACVADVVARAPQEFALCGYSMGGRIALHVALAHPERVTRLILVAATAGIEDDREREERRAADEQLAADIEVATIEQFIERWTSQPLFARTPPHAAAMWREDLLRNDPAALAAVLRGVGTGAMTPVWDRLRALPMPATVLAGERDAKFVRIGRRLTEKLTNSRMLIVPGAGHGLPREAPQAVAAAIASL